MRNYIALEFAVGSSRNEAAGQAGSSRRLATKRS
jgi:hypothetical protein